MGRADVALTGTFSLADEMNPVDPDLQIAEQLKGLITFDAGDLDNIFILGLPNFQTGPVAQNLRMKGYDIGRRCEAEQAAVIIWLLRLRAEHGDKWRAVAKEFLAKPIGGAT